jgi:membrane-bound serine protease (ClpP class)
MFDFGWQAWALLGAGLLVICFEILFPSAGLLGLLAGSCLVAGGWFAFKENGLSVLWGYGLCVIVLAPIAVTATFRLLPRTPMGRRMILKGPTFAAREATEEGLGDLIGKQGLAVTPLRPSGIATFGNRRVDVVTRGQHLPIGASVRVLKVEGNRVVVEESAA